MSRHAKPRSRGDRAYAALIALLDAAVFVTMLFVTNKLREGVAVLVTEPSVHAAIVVAWLGPARWAGWTRSRRARKAEYRGRHRRSES